MSNDTDVQTVTVGERALVLLSGGIDSTVCLAMAMQTQKEQQEEARKRNELISTTVEAISIDYGQRHNVELLAAKSICAHYGINHRVISHGAIPPSMLTQEDSTVPDISYDSIQGVSPMYVPFRNGQLLSIIAAHAQARQFSAIYFGAHMGDAERWAYPDCTPEFVGAMANAIYVGTYHQVRLHTPILWMTKDEVVKAGTALKAPLGQTWSCYKGIEENRSIHCGTCATCIERRRAFEKAGIEDPTKYENAY